MVNHYSGFLYVPTRASMEQELWKANGYTAKLDGTGETFLPLMLNVELLEKVGNYVRSIFENLEEHDINADGLWVHFLYTETHEELSNLNFYLTPVNSPITLPVRGEGPQVIASFENYAFFTQLERHECITCGEKEIWVRCEEHWHPTSMEIAQLVNDSFFVSVKD